MNFGWTLADVLKRSREVKAREESLKDKDTDTDNSQDCPMKLPSEIETTKENLTKPEREQSSEDNDEEKKKFGSPWIDIGTWSNEMASSPQDPDIDYFDPNAALPGNVTILSNLADMGNSGWGSSAPGSGWGSRTHVHVCPDFLKVLLYI